MISTSLSVWIAAICTIIIYSYSWKENIFFRIGEHTMIALTIAYWWVLAIKSIINIGIIPLSEGKFANIIPLILGFVLLTQFIGRYRWISRWPLAIIVGTSVGIAARAAVETMIIQQIKVSALSLLQPSALDSFNNLVVVAFTILGILYFYFTREFTGPLTTINKMGRYAFMLVFGAFFGGTVMTRFSLFIGRMSFLVKDWLGL